MESRIATIRAQVAAAKGEVAELEAVLARAEMAAQSIKQVRPAAVSMEVA